jgi:hypothetical protein
MFQDLTQLIINHRKFWCACMDFKCTWPPEPEIFERMSDDDTNDDSDATYDTDGERMSHDADGERMSDDDF